MIANKVVWSEGMFLQPHHFQQQDRYLENLIEQRSSALRAFAWGFSEMTLETDVLERGKFSLIAAKGVMPDGTIFSIPGNDLPPPTIEVKPGVTDSIVYLALPMRSSGAAEISFEKKASDARYTVDHNSVQDGVSGSEQVADIQVGKLALRLVVGKENLEAFTYLPVAKIKEVRMDHKIQLDPEFYPSCIDIEAVADLRKMLQETHSALRSKAQQMAYSLTDTKQAEAAEVEDLMTLHVVNRYESILLHLTRRPLIHPEFLYALYLQAVGELATFSRKLRRSKEMPIYQHENLYQSLVPLSRELIQLVAGLGRKTAESITLTPQKGGLWIGQLNDKDLLDSAQFVLAVHAEMNSEALRNAFPRQVKISALEQIRDLVSRALPGIDVQPVTTILRQIPFHANYVYFTVNTKHPYWKMLHKSTAIAIHVANNFPNLKLELWAVKGTE